MLVDSGGHEKQPLLFSHTYGNTSAKGLSQCISVYCKIGGPV